ncbi:hypothetical protein AKJ16_DCAP17301 [Drosera capensis]
MASVVDHPRRILRNFIPIQLCEELEFIHKSNCTVGYRPAVFSTTLSHLIATHCAHLVVPFVSLREQLKEKVEEVFGCEFELVIEFTGLISWTKGASIGWHSDDNRPYLKQRDFTAVCYLNNYGKDFQGGAFHFQEGEPASILPMTGVVDYFISTMDMVYAHQVWGSRWVGMGSASITGGERLTLTLWFSRNCSHDEDAKLISLLSQCTPDELNMGPCLNIPFPASNNMYWFASDDISDCQQGCDVRYARLLALGFNLHSCESDSSNLELISSRDDASDLLMKPLWLVREDEMFTEKFVNILHALQVVQFYFWRESELEGFKPKKNIMNLIVPISEAQRARINTLKNLLMKDQQLLEASFSYSDWDRKMRDRFNWVNFSGAVAAWEAYICKLHREMVLSRDRWRSHNSIFAICL